jgi:hypothetical protein
LIQAGTEGANATALAMASDNPNFKSIEWPMSKKVVQY